MRNSVKRWIGALLAACLVMALLPTAALATDTGKAIQRVSNDSADNIGGGQADNVYFGTYQQSSDGSGDYNTDPVKWRVLSNANRQLFLLSDQNLDVFQYHTEQEDVTWETSTMRSWLNGYDYTSDNFLDTAFSANEQAAIVETTVVNDDNKDENYGTDGEGGNNTTDRIFLLSIAEASNSSYFPGISSSRFSTNTAYVAAGGKLGSYMYGVGEGDRWWLRSPGFNNTMAACIDEYGGEVFEGNPVDDKAAAVRPAFNLNLSSVLFTSAATGGKPDGGLTAVADYTGNEWKLTLLDSSRNFTVSGESWDGNTLTFSYSGAQTGTNEYISAIIEENDAITYYGRILPLSDTTTGPSGTASLSLPDGVPLSETAKLYVFNEQCNGDYKTDYASELQNIFPAPAQAPSITTTSLSGGKVGEAYSQTLAATGTTPITWTLDSGSSLPAGLSLSGDTISGTPTTTGTFTFTVKAANSAGDDTKKLTIVIQAASVGPNPDPNPNPNPNPNYNQRPVIIIPTTDQNVSASVGNTVTMRITANYAQSYQWYVDTGSGFNAIPGATGAAYTTSQVALGNNGYRYYCVARNAYGTAVSPVFTLNVLEYMGIPATGDSAQAGLWIGFAMVSFAGLAAYAALWRRKRTN